MEENAIPDKVTDITILERLGGGSFGDVFKGDMKGVIVAMKKMKAEDPHTMEQLNREAELLSKLKNPCIVAYIGIFDKDGAKYIVMEYMPLGALDELLRTEDEKISDIELMYMAKDCSRGMEYLEENQIVHRDLALRNLLAKKESNRIVVKISDFGLSRILSNDHYSISDSPLPAKWSAPEVLTKSKFTPRSDSWSYGVLLYEIFTRGGNPYAGLSNAEVVERVLDGYRLPKPKGCNDEVYEVMKNCWAENPQDRPNFVLITKTLEEILGRNDPNSNYAILRNNGTQYEEINQYDRPGQISSPNNIYDKASTTSTEFKPANNSEYMLPNNPSSQSQTTSYTEQEYSLPTNAPRNSVMIKPPPPKPKPTPSNSEYMLPNNPSSQSQTTSYTEQEYSLPTNVPRNSVMVKNTLTKPKPTPSNSEYILPNSNSPTSSMSTSINNESEYSRPQSFAQSSRGVLPKPPPKKKPSAPNTPKPEYLQNNQQTESYNNEGYELPTDLSNNPYLQQQSNNQQYDPNQQYNQQNQQYYDQNQQNEYLAPRFGNNPPKTDSWD